MKFFSILTILAALLTTSCAAPRIKTEIVDDAIVKKIVKDTPDSADNIDLAKAKNIKTFDFEKIFAQANKYYDASVKWEKLKCVPQSSFVCTKRECPKLDMVRDSFMILDKKAKTVALCRDKYCSYFSARFEQVGVFVGVQIRELTGIYIKVLGDSRFKEISMVGLDAYITNGNCAVLEGAKTTAAKPVETKIEPKAAQEKPVQKL